MKFLYKNNYGKRKERKFWKILRILVVFGEFDFVLKIKDFREKWVRYIEY